MVVRAIVATSLVTGKVLQRFSARGGGAQDVVSDGHRGWFRSGIGLAHVLPNGQVDRAWQSNVQGRLAFGTLRRAGERLFVSDSLHVIAVDSKTGARLWTSPAIGGAHILSLAANRSACCRGGRRRSPTPARAAP